MYSKTEREVVASIVTAVWRRRGERGRCLCVSLLLYSSHSDFLQFVGCRGISHDCWVFHVNILRSLFVHFLFSVHKPTPRLWPSTSKRIDSCRSGIRAWFKKYGRFVGRHVQAHHLQLLSVEVEDERHARVQRPLVVIAVQR